eukprot:3506586-Pleurochrysis_carterae.AAC.3
MRIKRFGCLEADGPQHRVLEELHASALQRPRRVVNVAAPQPFQLQEGSAEAAQHEATLAAQAVPFDDKLGKRAWRRLLQTALSAPHCVEGPSGLRPEDRALLALADKLVLRMRLGRGVRAAHRSNLIRQVEEQPCAQRRQSRRAI